MAKKIEETQENTEKQAPEQVAGQVVEQIEKVAPEKPSANPDADTELESLPALADRHRTPSWQQAALMRLMGWADGKMVSNTDYTHALDRLKARRVGGGRTAPRPGEKE